MFDEKTERTFDTYGNITMYIDYYWENSTWRAWIKFKYENTYNDSGKLIEKAQYLWESNDWTGWNKDEWGYDVNGNLTMEASYGSMIDNIWIWSGESILTYFWNEKNIEVGISKLTSNISITIYPNPVSNILHIETGKADALPSVKIYSIMGTLLFNTNANQIDVSSLTRGIYIVEIDGICRKFTKM